MGSQFPVRVEARRTVEEECGENGVCLRLDRVAPGRFHSRPGQ